MAVSVASWVGCDLDDHDPERDDQFVGAAGGVAFATGEGDFAGGVGVLGALGVLTLHDLAGAELQLADRVGGLTRGAGRDPPLKPPLEAA